MMHLKENDIVTDTPFVALDLDTMERNIERMSHLAAEAQVKLRPHTKTHKSIYIAHKQLAAGATGITTAKLGEAEVMADAGIRDILIAFPLVGKRKLERFSNLVDRTNVMVALDDVFVAQGISAVGEAKQKKIPVYIDIDTGLQRMGRPPAESITHILEISKLPGIQLRGLMSHTGQAYSQPDEKRVRDVAITDALLLHEAQELLEKKGIHIPEISIGATATARFIKDIPFVTEMRPGMYVFNDRFVMGVGGATVNDCAISIVSTIVAHPTSDRFIIDAGSKTLAKDDFKEGGYGYIKDHHGLTVKSLSEEHGIIEIRGETSLGIGDVLEIIPNHVCPAINLADTLYGFRDGVLERVIPVDARGKNR